MRNRAKLSRAGGLWFIVVLLLCSGCEEPKPSAATAAPTSRIETTRWGPVTVDIEITPTTVLLDRDVLVNIRIEAPTGMRVSLPDLSDRFEGFTLSGEFPTEPYEEAGQTISGHRLQLTPLVANTYRIRALPLTYQDERVSPSLSGWFPSRPITIELHDRYAQAEGGEIKAEVEPLHIRPPARVYMLAAAAIVALIVVLAILWRVLTRVREEIQVRRMSPRERALRELSRLLSRDLVGQGHIKAFYVELTMIVRRYIERMHGIRAPEQTTEEFLAAVGEDRRFHPDTVARLQAFLQAADRVKFAAFHPESSEVDAATDTARDYLEHDTSTTEGDG